MGNIVDDVRNRLPGLYSLDLHRPRFCRDALHNVWMAQTTQVCPCISISALDTRVDPLSREPHPFDSCWVSVLLLALSSNGNDTSTPQTQPPPPGRQRQPRSSTIVDSPKSAPPPQPPPLISALFTCRCVPVSSHHVDVNSCHHQCHEQHLSCPGCHQLETTDDDDDRHHYHTNPTTSLQIPDSVAVESLEARLGLSPVPVPAPPAPVPVPRAVPTPVPVSPPATSFPPGHLTHTAVPGWRCCPWKQPSIPRCLLAPRCHSLRDRPPTPHDLLQTFSEGKFGKVKLGLHCQWGEEVAIKLIHRGSVDSSRGMSKVKREIEVLRVHHPFLLISSVHTMLMNSQHKLLHFPLLHHVDMHY